jgi:hypothetical protein
MLVALPLDTLGGRLMERAVYPTSGFLRRLQISTALIYGGNAETGLWSLVDGRSADLHLGITTSAGQ